MKKPKNLTVEGSVIATCTGDEERSIVMAGVTLDPGGALLLRNWLNRAMTWAKNPERMLQKRRAKRAAALTPTADAGDIPERQKTIDKSTRPRAGPGERG